MRTILIVDSNPGVIQTLGDIFRFNGYTPIFASDGRKALEIIREVPIKLVLLDLLLPDMDGMEVLQRFKEEKPSVPVVVISAYGTIAKAVKAIKLGAYDFLEKPLQAERVLLTVKNALDRAKLEEEREILLEEIKQRYSMIGTSPAIKRVYSIIDRVAPTNSKVLIVGETGTGKELVARAIHNLSPRAARPFVKVNCAAIPDGLIESELFGYKRGAFTGANTDKKGKFQKAHQGTLFLDEISDMSPKTQAKILRAIELGEVQRVGGEECESVDVRLIAATNKNLEKEVRAGRFREDLWYRLDVVRICLPPLRERREDIPPLANHFLRLFCEENNIRLKKLTPSAINALLQHPWRGNVRELKNVVERLAIITREKSKIHAYHVHQAIYEKSEEISSNKSLREIKHDIEKKLLLDKLRHHNWNITRTAVALGVSRTAVYKLLKKHKIDKRAIPK